MGGGRAVSVALGLGSLGFAGYGLAAPYSVGNMIGISPGVASALAWRDLALGVALLASGSRQALVARAIADLGDAALSARRRPTIAVVAAVSASTALAAASRSR